MQPRFRSDLKSSREEQQGVVFYRIDDPLTQTSFRLYEIEFLIAQKLNGERHLEQVIAAVKAEYNFDISEPDLKKFISQLESMGFIQTRGAAVAAGPPPTHVDAVPTPPPEPPKSIHDDITSPGIADYIAPLPDAATGAGADRHGVETSELDLEETMPSFERPLLDDVPFGGPDEDGIPTAPGLATGVEAVFESQETDRTEEVEVVAAADFDPRRGAASPEEVVRMIATACEHLRQGYVVHARDYFLAARESKEDDPALAKMVAQLQLVGDEPDMEAIREVRILAAELFPELAGDMPVGEETARPRQAFDDEREENLRSRLLWVLVLLLVIAGGVAALYYVATEARIFEGTAIVEVKELEAAQLPAFYRGSAVSVGPMREEWLKTGGSGKVEEVVEPGAQVRQGDIILMLQLHPKAKKKLEKARADLQKLAALHKKAEARLTAIAEERDGIMTERNEAEAELKKARPLSVLKGGSVSKRDMEKYKRILALANKKLTKLAKKEQKPSQLEKKAKAKVEAAGRKLEKIEGSISAKLLKAPYSGVVAEVKVKAGDPVKAGQEVVFFRDPVEIRLVFNVPDAGILQPRGEASVSVESAGLSKAKVLAVTKTQGGVELAVKLPDPASAFVEMEPGAFRLVREFVEPAFWVDTSALVEDAQTRETFVYVAIQGQAVRREVELLSRNPNRSSVRSLAGSLRNGDQVIVSYPDHGSVAELLENASVDPKKAERE